jgi:hypothetical protein
VKAEFSELQVKDYPWEELPFLGLVQPHHAQDRMVACLGMPCLCMQMLHLHPPAVIGHRGESQVVRSYKVKDSPWEELPFLGIVQPHHAQDRLVTCLGMPCRKVQMLHLHPPAVIGHLGESQVLEAKSQGLPMGKATFLRDSSATSCARPNGDWLGNAVPLYGNAAPSSTCGQRPFG